MQGAGLVPASGGGGMHHRRYRLRGDVRGHANDPLAADRHHREGEGVVAGQHGKRADAQDGADAIHATGGLLDGNNLGVAGESCDGGYIDFATRPAGDVIKDDGQAEIGDGGEVPVQAFLIRLVIIGGDLEGAVCSGVQGVFGQGQGFGGGIGAGTGDDLELALSGRDAGFDDFFMFIDVDGGGLPGGADGDDAIHAALDLHGNEGAEFSVINAAISVERCDECCIGSGKHDAFSLWQSTQFQR